MYRIKNPSGKYLSFDFQGNPRFFEGIDMSYSFPLETAQKIVEKFPELKLEIESDGGKLK